MLFSIHEMLTNQILLFHFETAKRTRSLPSVLACWKWPKTGQREGLGAKLIFMYNLKHCITYILCKTVMYNYISLQLCTTYATNFIVKTQVEALYTHMRVSHVILILFVCLCKCGALGALSEWAPQSSIVWLAIRHLQCITKLSPSMSVNC